MCSVVQLYILMYPVIIIIIMHVSVAYICISSPLAGGLKSVNRDRILHSLNMYEYAYFIHSCKPVCMYIVLMMMVQRGACIMMIL